VGVIPEDWEVKAMAELFTFQNGVNADKSAYGIGIPFINVLEVITYSTLTEVRIPGKISLSAQARSAFAVQYGDVLFNRTSETQEEVGLASVYTGTAAVVFGGFVIRARPRDNSMDPIFTSYALRSPAIRSQIVARGQGAVRANIGQQELSRVQVFLPTKAEQEAIAESLSDADALIESLEQLIAKKRHIKQGAMQELLTGKKRLPGFATKPGYKQTEVGVIPEDWNTLALDNATVKGGLVRGPFGGALKKELFVERGYKVYEQRNAIYATVEKGDYFIDSSKYKELERFHVLPGDLIVSCSGTIGCIYQIPAGAPEGVINQALLKIILNDEIVNGAFFLAVFRSESFQERIKENSHGGAMQNLVGMDVFRKTPFQLPPKAEQEAIAAILTDMDAEIVVLEEKLAKARRLKQGMMQELLTGRTHLV
jgi:type I restriction enzyme S subunit